MTPGRQSVKVEKSVLRAATPVQSALLTTAYLGCCRSQAEHPRVLVRIASLPVPDARSVLPSHSSFDSTNCVQAFDIAHSVGEQPDDGIRQRPIETYAGAILLKPSDLAGGALARTGEQRDGVTTFEST